MKGKMQGKIGCNRLTKRVKVSRMRFVVKCRNIMGRKRKIVGTKTSKRKGVKMMRARKRKLEVMIRCKKGRRQSNNVEQRPVVKRGGLLEKMMNVSKREEPDF